MPNNETITVTCHACGHSWPENLARAAAERVVYRGEKRQQVEEYLFTCKKCGERTVAEVTREA